MTSQFVIKNSTAEGNRQWGEVVRGERNQVSIDDLSDVRRGLLARLGWQVGPSGRGMFAPERFQQLSTQGDDGATAPSLPSVEDLIIRGMSEEDARTAADNGNAVFEKPKRGRGKASKG